MPRPWNYQNHLLQLEETQFRHGGERLRRLKELEEENRKLKSMYADLALDNKMLKDVLSKKW